MLKLKFKRKRKFLKSKFYNPRNNHTNLFNAKTWKQGHKHMHLSVTEDNHLWKLNHMCDCYVQKFSRLIATKSITLMQQTIDMLSVLNDERECSVIFKHQHLPINFARFMSFVDVLAVLIWIKDFAFLPKMTSISKLSKL